MTKTITKKLYLNESGSFQETELPGRPYIVANQDIEIVQEKVAVIRYSGCMTSNILKKCLDTAINMGFKTFFLVGDAIYGPYQINSQELNSTILSGGSGAFNIARLKEIDEKYDITLFTSAEADLPPFDRTLTIVAVKAK